MTFRFKLEYGPDQGSVTYDISGCTDYEEAYRWANRLARAFQMFLTDLYQVA